jgi:hypothetical protein
MRAAIFRNGEIVVDTMPAPEPAAGQVLVKTLAWASAVRICMRASMPTAWWK